MAARSRPLTERFWEKVDMSGGDDACWLWRGASSARGEKPGYGHIRSGGYGPNLGAHVVAWQLEHRRQVPTGLTIDHLCRNTLCVNWRHLEAVPLGVNLDRGLCPSTLNAQKTHCIRGHANWRLDKQGKRYCRTCMNMHSRNLYAATRGR